LDEATCVYGAGVLLKHLQSLEEEVAGVQSGSKDIEYIHRARVASRRLRAAVPLFQNCLPSKKSSTWLKQLRKVTRALGEARDTDVQIDRLNKFYLGLTERRCKPGIQRLLLRLHQKRERLETSTVQAMDKLIKKQLLEEMRAKLEPQAEREKVIYIYTLILYQHWFRSINRRLEDFLSFEAIVGQPEKVEELHQMRIAAKWLRYTSETFAPLYPEQLKIFLQMIRKMQDMLGDIHDYDVWGNFLPLFLEEERQRTREYYGREHYIKRIIPGITYFQQECLQSRAELYQSFVQTWNQSQEENIWNRLHQTIQVPYLQLDALYPPQTPNPPPEKTE